MGPSASERAALSMTARILSAMVFRAVVDERRHRAYMAMTRAALTRPFYGPDPEDDDRPRLALVP